MNLNDEELEQLDNCLEQIGFKNRSEYLTACATVLIYGEDSIDLNKNLHDICENKNAVQKALFEILDEGFFSIIAMKGTKVVISPDILNDIKRDILNRCDMLPEDKELEKLIEAYRYINLAKLAEYRARVTKERFEEEDDEESADAND